MKDERCHHPVGNTWCTRKTGHRKPHRYEPRPISDEELVRQVMTLWAAIHPGSHHRIGWVIPEGVRDRFVAMARVDTSVAWMHRAEDSPPPVLMGRPVRVGGTAIQLEVVGQENRWLR